MTEAARPARAKAPWHLWVVGVLALLWNVMGAFDYLMTQTRNDEYMGSFTQEQLDFFHAFPSWLVALWAIAVWGGVLGVLLLLFRRRFATPVLAVSLACMVITAIHNFGFANGMEVMGTAGLVFTLLVFAVAVLLVLYASALARRGVLS